MQQQEHGSNSSFIRTFMVITVVGLLLAALGGIELLILLAFFVLQAQTPGALLFIAVVVWPIVGLIAGFFARFVPGSNGSNADIAVGITGAVIGGLLTGMLRIGNSYDPIGNIIIDLTSIIFAFVGACLFIAVGYALLPGRRKR